MKRSPFGRPKRFALGGALVLAAAVATPPAAAADTVIMLQRSNLRGGPSLRNPIVAGADRYEVFSLLDVYIDERANLWYQVDRDVRSTYWRYVKYTNRGWIRTGSEGPADVFAYPVNGRNPVEIRERAVEPQRMRSTGDVRGEWKEVVYMSREVFLKNKAWVFSELTCRRPNRNVEESRAFIAKIDALDLPEEVKSWLIIGRTAGPLDELQAKLAEVDPKDRVQVARDLLFPDRTLRLGMTPSQARLAWGDPLSVVRVEGEEPNQIGMEWTYRSVTVRFMGGLLTEIFPGTR